jgi:hypothetical protein
MSDRKQSTIANSDGRRIGKGLGRSEITSIRSHVRGSARIKEPLQRWPAP